MFARLHKSLPQLRLFARCGALLLLASALCVQQWAVHSHWHANVVAAAQTAVEAPASDPLHGGLPGHDCLLCHVAAHASAAPPPATDYGALVADVHVFATLPCAAVADFSSSPAWAWQSRGPPTA